MAPVTAVLLMHMTTEVNSFYWVGFNLFEYPTDIPSFAENIDLNCSVLFKDAFWCLVSLLENYVKGYYGLKLVSYWLVC